MMSLKKTEYDKLVNKVNGIDTSIFVLKTKYDTDKLELENKIPNITNLIKKTDYNTKIGEIEGKIPSITVLATTSALTALENKIASVTNLVEKIDYNTKVSEINKKITDHTTEFNKLKLAQADLVTKTDFDNKLRECNKKIVSNKTKSLLIEKKLDAFDLSYFRGKNYFDEDGTQNWLVYQPMDKYLKTNYTNNINYVVSWQSKGVNDYEINSIYTNNHLLNPRVDQYDTSEIRIKFDGSFLHAITPSINHGKKVNIYIVYEISSHYNDITYPTLENCLFGSVKLTKNKDTNKYKYSGYGIGFDRKRYFFLGYDIGKNVIIFGADSNKRDVLVLGKAITTGLGDQLSSDKMYSINFTKIDTKFSLSLHYNGDNSYLFFNGTEIINLKAKDSEIKPYSLCLSNISKDWSHDNIKKTRLKDYIYDFSTDYSAISVDDIKDIHKYLMKKNGMV